jgi:hypothetical protein
MTTTNKGLTDPANGSLNWDTPLNANFDIIDKAFGGTVTKNVTGLSGTITLAEADYQNLTIRFTGTISANLIYQVPAGVGGQWMLTNGTTGAFTLTFRTAAAGTTVVVPSGYNVTAYSDGTNVFFETAFISPTLLTPTTSGTITVAGGTQNWTVIPSGTNLTFAYNGVNKARLDSSGNLTVTGNVTAYGTIT